MADPAAVRAGAVPRSPVLSPPAFVGRATELAELGRALADPPAVVLVAGEAGIGKTLLLHEFFAGRDDHDRLVAVCRRCASPTRWARWSTRSGRWPPACTGWPCPRSAVLGAAAVLSDPAGETTLLAVTGLPEQPGRTGLAEALWRGLLQQDARGRIAFRRALACRAVHEAIPRAAAPHPRPGGPHCPRWTALADRGDPVVP